MMESETRVFTATEEDRRRAISGQPWALTGKITIKRGMASVTLDPTSIQSYRLFKKIKRFPSYRVNGRVVSFPSEYCRQIGMESGGSECTADLSSVLFDYQKSIAEMSIEKRKYAVFADCGLGKTLIQLEFAKAAAAELNKTNQGFLIVAPLMVVSQTLSEAAKFYPELEIEKISASGLQLWLAQCGGKIGITNYEAIRDIMDRGRLGGLLLDESSMLKSHYGKWGTRLLDLGKGLAWKHAGSGTPAPNDRIEYANHAVFMDASHSVNAFLATYFINRGQTQDRWALKPHALKPFYRSLSHWSIFLTNPATYGWRDNCDTIPPINVHYHPVDLTREQIKIVESKTRQLFATDLGGIGSRASLGQIAKGHYDGRSISTNKPAKIAELVESWPDESTIIWCLYNEEQSLIAKLFPDAANISGSTPLEKRLELIDDFKKGQRKILITKPKILGFGLNLQVATRQIFSGLQDSYEQFYQAVKRSNRIGSTRPLNVHIPLTDIEEPMVQNVMRKASNVQVDTEAQEQLFKELSCLKNS
jgi:superfamily II DNA or RNA helicase